MSRRYLVAEMRVREVPEDHVNILDEAWSHPYACRCDVCLSGWALVGPDGQPGDYGPFMPQEVHQRQREMGVEVTE